MITHNEVFFNQDEYGLMKINMSESERFDFLTKKMLDGTIKFPYKNISLEEAWDSFNELVVYPCRGPQKLSNVYTKFPYKYDYSGYTFSETTQGSLASDKFMERYRYKVRGSKNISPYEAFHNPKYFRAVLKMNETLKHKEISTQCLRPAINHSFYIAAQFKPAVARALYQFFNAERVLDMSMGWGDRLCGFYSLFTTKEYYGIDPNSEIFNEYSKMADFYSRIIGQKKKTVFFNKPAEDVLWEKDNNGEYLIPNEYFDVAFTSPPYFTIERYSDEDTQSSVRYSQLDIWLEKFLYPMLEGSWRTLKHGGVLAINISDQKVNNSINKFGDPLCDYVMNTFKDAEYLGYYGMRIAKRNLSNTAKAKLIREGKKVPTGTPIEPIFCFRKK